MARFHQTCGKSIAILITAVLFIFSACSPSPPAETTSPAHQTTTPQTATTELDPSPSPTITSSPDPEISPSQVLSVHFIDVGQGDSILIDLDETEVLIDGGDRSPGVVNYLSSYVDGELDVMVATHAHADHIGGLIDVLSEYEVKEIWLNGYTATSKTYEDFMSLVNAENAVVCQAECGKTVQAGSLTFNVLNPPKQLFSDANSNSIVLSLSYGEIDFLFTGDAEVEAEEKMLLQSYAPVPDVEILKVGHHGSSTASSPQFLNIVKPDVAIYMCGAGNTYGHPHEESIAALNGIGAETYGTDVNGTIIVSTDGKVYDIQPQSGNTSTALPSSPQPSTPTPTSDTVVNVQITKIFYDGAVPRVESDEYVEIANLGSEPVDLKDWVLKDITDGKPSFIFPSYLLQSGESIRVYTNEIQSEYGGFSFGSETSVWNNSSPDTAALFNAQGQEVSRKSY